MAVRGRAGVRAAIVSAGGRRETIRCDAVVLSLELVPRDGLLRQAGGLPVEAIGDIEPACSLPSEPREGFVCLCEDVEARDLEIAWGEGFRSTELLKRYTTATMGPCQGALCQAPLRAFVAARAGNDGGQRRRRRLVRPRVRIRLEEAAAGVHFAIEQRTALHDRHLELGARMEWAGAWRRPETYGDTLAEYWAVRADVSMMDVGTLGKFLVAGPDATELPRADLSLPVGEPRAGRAPLRPAAQRGRLRHGRRHDRALGGGRYYVTFTSGGAEGVEAWLRDWADAWGSAVHIVNLTAAVGAINVAGPRSRELLLRAYRPARSAKLVPVHAPPRDRRRRSAVPRDPARLRRRARVRAASRRDPTGCELWDALLGAGRDLGIRPHGLDALRLLRLEKGHIIVGPGHRLRLDAGEARAGLGGGEGQG